MTTTTNKTNFWRAAFATTMALAFCIAPSTAQAGSDVRLEVRLTGNPAASGKAKYEEKAGRRKFSIEVQRAARNVPLQMVVRRGSQVWIVANASTNNFGFVDINRDTANGHAVPIIVAGDLVEVRTATAVLLRGVLHPR